MERRLWPESAGTKGLGAGEAERCGKSSVMGRRQAGGQMEWRYYRHYISILRPGHGMARPGKVWPGALGYA